ncbi:hypothetical protein PSHI8_06790 [Polynucleobacter sp. SHI8]|uniref:DUF4149 domain-containing protein n=1 Tax=unclassified Polynucleobacter TaxID=2640945 RepID=UPI00248FAF36|nr:MULTISPECIES: DUF4149 domain-containing protein [unclassified Polynucleobacter]BDW10597.1 hypothetical protein PSHI2_06790 [Polynucleobacter sp. SHI2]BDW13043.1 hypothetical protein PSHI8_06790 [Polynucleobacter sp. SHI8]
MQKGSNSFLAQRIFLIISGLLFGGLATVGFLVTPSLFFVLADKQVAGMIAGEIFKNTSLFSLLISVFLLIYSNLLVKRGLHQFKWSRWLLLISIVLTLIGTFVVQPMMNDLRELALSEGAPVMQSPQAKEFKTLHQLSSVLFTLEVMVCAGVFWLASRLQLNQE